MSETLRQKQSRFVKSVGLLIAWAYANGLELTFGETVRSKQEAEENDRAGVGISNSLHTIRLAIDLNLFVHGIYRTDSDAYRSLGSYWKSLGPDHRWGGDFRKPDGNHFSIEHNGVK